MQAAVQRHVDAVVAKTVNLPEGATRDDIRRLYVDVWQANVKGITVSRDGSRPGQVLRRWDEPAPVTGTSVEVDGAYSGGGAHRACTCDLDAG
jgi:ribonucleoside-diphosphate reductase alpha chain